MQMNSLCHWEIPADDLEKLAEFYEKLMGWTFKKEPGPMEYWLIETDPEGQAVAGGMMRRQVPEESVINYYLVESITDMIAQAKELGAQVVMEKTEIPGHGWVAVVIDPQRNPLGFFEAA